MWGIQSNYGNFGVNNKQQAITTPHTSHTQSRTSDSDSDSVTQKMKQQYEESEPLLKQSGSAEKRKDEESQIGQQEEKKVEDRSCISATCDFFQRGPKSVNVDKEKWQWWHAWHVSANLRQIFARDRDSDLNVLDGVRALAYLW